MHKIRFQLGLRPIYPAWELQRSPTPARLKGAYFQWEGRGKRGGDIEREREWCERTPTKRSDKIPHRTALDPQKLGEVSPQPCQTMLLWAQVPSPLWVGARNSPVPPIQRQLPPLPSLVRLRVAQVPSLLWVGTRDSAGTSIESQGLKRTFTLPHRAPKRQKTTAPDPNKLAEGSPQSKLRVGTD